MANPHERPRTMSGKGGAGGGGDVSEESRPRGPLTPEPLLSTSSHLLVPGGAGRNCLEDMQEWVSSEPGYSKQNQIVHED